MEGKKEKSISHQVELMVDTSTSENLISSPGNFTRDVAAGNVFFRASRVTVSSLWRRRPHMAATAGPPPAQGGLSVTLCAPRFCAGPSLCLFACLPLCSCFFSCAHTCLKTFTFVEQCVVFAVWDAISSGLMPLDLSPLLAGGPSR